MHSHYIFVPLIIVLGTLFLIYMLKRSRRPRSVGAGRPDETERPELRGTEQRKQRPW